MTDLAPDELPDVATARPVWLITLADLALLLVGFFVLLEANQQLDRKALAQGLREGFGVYDAPVPMAVTAGALTGFAPGAADLPGSVDALAAWARQALRDRRVMLRVSGAVDGTPRDVDPASGSAAVLAADRARGAAVALIAAGIPADRLALAGAARPGRRSVTVITAYAGDRP